MKISFTFENGMGGGVLKADNGELFKVKGNFRATNAENGREVILIWSHETIRDMNASWGVNRLDCYYSDSLEKVKNEFNESVVLIMEAEVIK